MSQPLLELSAVQTHIGAYHILHGVDFCVPEGQVTMLLGRNGAGKTTTLRTVMGLWPASAGELRFQGKSIKGQATPDIANLGIAYVPESMGIFSDLTVKDNMLLAARQARHAGELDTQRLEWIFGLFPALKKFGLVDQDQRTRLDDGAGHSQHLLLPARQLARRVEPKLFECREQTEDQIGRAHV